MFLLFVNASLLTPLPMLSLLHPLLSCHLSILRCSLTLFSPSVICLSFAYLSIHSLTSYVICLSFAALSIYSPPPLSIYPSLSSPSIICLSFALLFLHSLTFPVVYSILHCLSFHPRLPQSDLTSLSLPWLRPNSVWSKAAWRQCSSPALWTQALRDLWMGLWSQENAKREDEGNQENAKKEDEGKSRVWKGRKCKENEEYAKRDEGK